MRVPLGKTGLKVNPIGFGGIPIQRLSPQESGKVIKKALDMGINFFDTSRIYTDSEEKLGRIFSQPQYKDKRETFIIATKTFSREGKPAAKDLETGLKLLKTGYIDLYQCHNIGNDEDLQKILAPGSVLDVLQKAREKGKIRNIGITGHKPTMLMKALKAFDFDTVQVPLNYIEQACLEELVPYAKERGIGVIAMKPVGGGAFKHVPLVLRFNLTHGADVVIPGMDSEHQVIENLSVLENLNPLTGEEMAVLQKEKEVLGENFCRRCEYCMPCPQGLPIPFLHVLRAYYFRYNLQDWALERMNNLPKSYKDCIECGECVKKCPYELDTPGIFKETWEEITTRN
jgi:predicted aldo/keto reductase-like oxidoreductase